MKHSYLCAITALGAWLTLATTLAASAYAQPTTPLPFIDQVQPASARLDSHGYILTLKGANFRPGAMVDWQVGTKHECLFTYVISASELVAWVPAALTAHAATATVTVANPERPSTASASNAVLIPITRPTAGLAFSQSNILLAGSPNSIVTGDFNRDGKIDLAVSVPCLNPTCTNQDGIVYGIVAIYLGNGNGTFTTLPTVAVPNYPSAMTLGDFNGDGKMDIAVLNQGAGTVTILFGDGHGGFAMAPLESTVGAGPVAIQAGDVNGDGKLDLVVANSIDNTVSILLGSGNGNFDTTFTLPTGPEPIKVFLGDINGDGKLDVVVGNSFAPYANVLLGHGNGTFTAAPSPSAPQTPTGLADLNGDGKLDLLFFYGNPVPTQTSILALLGNGNGTFRAGPGSPQLDVLANQGGVLADFNGDGILDFAAQINYPINGYDFLLGNGHGVFKVVTTNNLSNDGIGPAAEGDFNGDGRLDLVAFDYVDGGQMAILLQQPVP